MCLECRDHCFCIACFVKSIISSEESSENSECHNGTDTKAKTKKICFVNPSGEHKASHRMLLLDHVCDQCNSLIIGKRISCLSCVDYDLCLSCHRDIMDNAIKPSKHHKSDHKVCIENYLKLFWRKLLLIYLIIVVVFLPKKKPNR